MLDLRPEHYRLVRDILEKHVPEYEVRAFGSRVAGCAREFSDLDRATIATGPLSFELLGQIRDAFSESDLPFKVDVLDWSTTSAGFRRLIQEKHLVLKDVKH